MESSTDTVFDKIISGEIPVDAVFENEDILAFNDLNPQAPVHVLVIPKKRVSRFSELSHKTINETGTFFAGVSEVAAFLNLDDHGYRIVVNNGSDGGQEVEYLHAHILGGRKLTWPPG